MHVFVTCKILFWLIYNRSPGEESDTESSRETSSDGGSFEHGLIRGTSSVVQTAQKQQNSVDINVQRINGISVKDHPSNDSSSDEADISTPPGQLIFEYLERDPPFTREPLVDKVPFLTEQQLLCSFMFPQNFCFIALS